MLTTTDWIAISAATLQVAVAIGVGIWQVRQTQRPNPTIKNPKPRLSKFEWKWFLRQSWQFVFCAVVAVALLWQTLASSQPFTKSLMLEIVFYSLMLVFGVTFTLIAVIATAARPAFVQMGRSFKDLKESFANLEKKRDKNSRKPTDPNEPSA